MQTYCLSCRKHTDNIGSKKVIMTNKVAWQVSKCANCVAEKSRFLKQKSDKKSNLNKINPKLFIYYTQVITCWHLFEVLKTKNDRTTLSSKCAVCSSQKSRCMKEQEAKRILSSSGLKTSLNKILLLDKVLF